MAATVRRLAGGAAAGLALALAWAAGGCTPAPVEPEVHPVWPAPPAAPRVRHLRNIQDASDAGKPGPMDALANLLTGRSPLALLRPHGVAVDADRRLYVTDQELQALVIFDLKAHKTAAVTRIGRTFLVSPVGVTLCGRQVALSDSALKSVFILSPDGKLARTIEKPGGFLRPTGLAYDAGARELYVVDTLAHEVCVFDFAGGRLMRRVGTPGVEPGQLNFPTHLFLDRQGRLYVTDSLNFRVQVFDRKGEYLLHIGRLGDASGHLAVPKGVGVDSFGHVYIVDSYFSTVQIFDRRGRFLLAVGELGSGPGRFHVPAGLTVDAEDRLYVCDSFNKRIQILQYVGGAEHDANSIGP